MIIWREGLPMNLKRWLLHSIITTSSHSHSRLSRVIRPGCRRTCSRRTKQYSTSSLPAMSGADAKPYGVTLWTETHRAKWSCVHCDFLPADGGVDSPKHSGSEWGIFKQLVSCRFSKAFQTHRIDMHAVILYIRWKVRMGWGWGVNTAFK